MIKTRPKKCASSNSFFNPSLSNRKTTLKHYDEQGNILQVRGNTDNSTNKNFSKRNRKALAKIETYKHAISLDRLAVEGLNRMHVKPSRPFPRKNHWTKRSNNLSFQGRVFDRPWEEISRKTSINYDNMPWRYLRKEAEKMAVLSSLNIENNPYNKRFKYKAKINIEGSGIEELFVKEKYICNINLEVDWLPDTNDIKKSFFLLIDSNKKELVGENSRVNLEFDEQLKASCQFAFTPEIAGDINFQIDLYQNSARLFRRKLSLIAV